MAFPTSVNSQVTDTVSQAILNQQAASVAAMTQMLELSVQNATAHANSINALREVILAVLTKSLTGS